MSNRNALVETLTTAGIEVVRFQRLADGRTHTFVKWTNALDIGDRLRRVAVRADVHQLSANYARITA